MTKKWNVMSTEEKLESLHAEIAKLRKEIDFITDQANKNFKAINNRLSSLETKHK
jgi:hypothetical protein